MPIETLPRVFLHARELQPVRGVRSSPGMRQPVRGSAHAFHFQYAKE
jgi:hypothetical protein